MNDFFENRGLLKAVIAEGIISTYEVNSLKSGTLIYFTDRECGQPVSLYFNNRLIGYGEVIIIDNQFAIRMEKTTKWMPQEISVISKPLMDENEILKSQLILGTREIKLSNVLKITAGTIIPINCVEKYNKNEITRGKLFVEEVEVATGKIAINEENWVIEVEDVNFRGERDIPRRDSHVPLSSRIKYYDFTRPDCVTRSHIRGFARVHEFFGNYIGGKVKVVDQMTWGELRDEYKEWNLLISKKERLKTRKLSGENRYYIPLDDVELQWESKELEEFSREYAIKLLNDQVMEKVGFVYRSEKADDKFNNGYQDTITLLETSWKEVTRLSFGEKQVSNINTDDFLEEWEMIVIVKMEMDKEEFILVYPLAYFVQIINEF